MSSPNPSRRGRNADRDTMRAEYDFSKGVRGVTARRYAQGTNVVLLDADVAKVFPDSASVNQALRVLAQIAKSASAPRRRKKSA
jgi:hypothetical protein